MNPFPKCFLYLTILVVSFIGLLLVKNSVFDGFNRLYLAKEDSQVHSNDVTVITLYAALGKFQKGGPGRYFTKNTYTTFMKTWAWLNNKVVAFFDNDEDLAYFRTIRSAQPPDRTVLVKVSWSQLDGFKDYDKINSLYSRPDYPKHHPNTVNANYSCTMNAKYDALQMAMDMGHVTTEYLAWLDIGTFRNMLQLRKANETFTLVVPEGFNESRIGFTEVARQNMEMSPWEYISKNHVWVAGSFLIGSQTVVKKFIKAYKKTVRALLDSNMSSTDQQIIGAMYSPQFRQDQEVDIATYRCKNGDYGLYWSDVAYFCLAYVTKAAGEALRNKTVSLNRQGRVL